MKVAPQGVHRTRVEWVDTDAAGIHHNTAVTRFVEAAEAASMRGRGLDDYFSRAPRVHFEVDLTAPLHFGQEVTATVELVRLGRSPMSFSFELWGESHAGRPRVLAAKGSYITVHVGSGHDVDSEAASEPWPAVWVDILQPPTQSPG